MKMKRERIFLWGIVLCACVFVFACRTPPEVVRVKMDYTPTNIVPPPKILPDTLLFIAVQDRRKTPDQIGQNSENPKIVPAKVEPAEVAPFVEKGLKKELKKAGLNPVESRQQAKRIVQVALLNLWVEEKDTFQSSMVAEVNVLDKSGRKLFSENFRGLAQNWGTSYSEEKYRQGVSDAIADFVKNLFNSDAFMKSLK